MISLFSASLLPCGSRLTFLNYDSSSLNNTNFVVVFDDIGHVRIPESEQKLLALRNISDAVEGFSVYLVEGKPLTL